MMEQGPGERDVVTRILRYCHQHHDAAERLFDSVALRKARTVALPEEEIELSEAEAREFVERYSAEFEPTVWESKRLKH